MNLRRETFASQESMTDSSMTSSSTKPLWVCHLMYYYIPNKLTTDG